MWLLFGLFTLLFVCSSFLTQIAQELNDPLLVIYLWTQLSFINSYYLLFVIGIVIAIVYFFRLNLDKRYTPVRIFFLSVLQTIFLFLGSMLCSFVVVCIIGYLHLTIFSGMLSINPGLLGITSDTELIAKRLHDNSQSAKIVLVDPEKESMAFTFAKITSGSDNMYGRYLLPSIPQGVVLPVTKEMPSMILLDNTLIVTRVDEEQLEAISPELGYLLVKQYFPRRLIKAYPKLSFMDKTGYQKYRQEDAKKKIVQIDKEIEKMQGIVSSLSAQLETDTRQKRQIQKILADYEYYEDYFKTQKEKMQEATSHIPNELGFFHNPDTIQIIYVPPVTNKKVSVGSTRQIGPSLIDYFETLTHEYLHYASFIDEDQRISSSFFEEALTEYFARNIIEQGLSTKTNLGYPLQVKIMTEMTKMYTESELAEIYFTKDEVALASALNRVYGDNFYEENFPMFETMQYTSSRKQALTLANMIMKKIGGAPLTEKDLVSSYTSL